MTRASSIADEHRLAEAAAWRALLAERQIESCVELERWLEAAPANKQAFQLADETWRLVGEAATTPELMDFRRSALKLAAQRGRTGRAFCLPPSWMTGAITALVILGLGAIGMNWWTSQPQDYETRLGERRVVTLEDGSRMSLDSDSRVRVRYLRNARKLELTRGQARFDVAHNAQRPFSVRARTETVIATGTAFNVDILGSQTFVTLITGHVSVVHSSTPSPRGAAQRPVSAIALDPGQQLAVSETGIPSVVKTASIERATAWERGYLEFDDDPLGQVVQRISRYSARRLIADPSIAQLRISGIFNEGDVDEFDNTMTSYFPIKAIASVDGDVILTHR